MNTTCSPSRSHVRFKALNFTGDTCTVLPFWGPRRHLTLWVPNRSCPAPLPRRSGLGGIGASGSAAIGAAGVVHHLYLQQGRRSALVQHAVGVGGGRRVRVNSHGGAAVAGGHTLGRRGGRLSIAASGAPAALALQALQPVPRGVAPAANLLRGRGARLGPGPSRGSGWRRGLYRCGRDSSGGCCSGRLGHRCGRSSSGGHSLGHSGCGCSRGSGGRGGGLRRHRLGCRGHSLGHSCCRRCLLG